MTARLIFALMVAAALAACQTADPSPATPPSGAVAQAPGAASRAVPVPLPAASLAAAPGALPAGRFRTESGQEVQARTVWQTMASRGGRSTAMGRLVPANRDASLQAEASVLVGGPTGIDVPVWWRRTSASSVVLEVDGRPVLNLPCQSGRAGAQLRCFGDDDAATDRARAALEAGRTLRLVFLRGDMPASELSFDLSGLRGRS